MVLTRSYRICPTLLCATEARGRGRQRANSNTEPLNTTRPLVGSETCEFWANEIIITKERERERERERESMVDVDSVMFTLLRSMEERRDVKVLVTTPHKSSRLQKPQCYSTKQSTMHKTRTAFQIQTHHTTPEIYPRNVGVHHNLACTSLHSCKPSKDRYILVHNL